MKDIDKIVGRRLRERREALGISRSELGKVVGVSWAQIQRNENAINRIPAGRLYVFAHHLRMPVAWFFFDPNPEISAEDEEEEAAMLRAFRNIETPRGREAVLKLARSLVS